jgi:hypothetical protein
MSSNRILAALALAGAAVSLNACGHAREALGLAKVTPDEFRVVTKAPLTLPPEYDLRAPTPGAPRPQELAAESAARVAMTGASASAPRSDGETLLLKQAGAYKADPHARWLVDDEQGGIAHKDRSFADLVMFWRPGAAAADIAQDQNAQAALTPHPLDPEAEAQAPRVKQLTGGKNVIIAKQAPKEKLPGL